MPRLQSINIADCAFEDNHASLFGGAISLYHSDARIVRCSFVGNSAKTQGGALRHVGSSPTIEGCTFINNESEDGGALYGNALVIGKTRFPSSPAINSCVFVANRASLNGAAIMSRGLESHPHIHQSTLVGNVSTMDVPAIFVQVSSITIRDSILWGNNAPPYPSISVQLGPCGLTIENSIVQHELQSVWTHPQCTLFYYFSNTDDDPRFLRMPDDGGDGWGDTNDDYGNLALSATSPAINAGDPLYDPQVLGDRDLDGFPRVLFEQVDLGAYEFGPFAWAECIAGPSSRAPTPTCTVLDADRDGDVDLIDLAEFEASLGN